MSFVMMGLGPVVVSTTSNGGFSVEYWADRLLDKIIHISDSAVPEIRDQANAFKAQLKPAIVHYMKQSINSDRTTLAAKLKETGHNDVAEIIGRL